MAKRKTGLSILDKGLRVEGIVSVEEKLIILGSLQGTLIGHTVITAEGSRVVAEAKVRHLVIGGDFEGNVTAHESLKILKTGNFYGNVVCRKLDLEPGGQLNGRVEIVSAEEDIPDTHPRTQGVEENPPSSEREFHAGTAHRAESC